MASQSAGPFGCGGCRWLAWNRRTRSQPHLLVQLHHLAKGGTSRGVVKIAFGHFDRILKNARQSPLCGLRDVTESQRGVWRDACNERRPAQAHGIDMLFWKNGRA